MSRSEIPFDVYRAVNEQVRALAARNDARNSHDDAWEFLCECGERGCFEQVSLRVSEFDGVVASGGSVLADGHVLVAAGQARANARRLREEALALRAQGEQALRQARRLGRTPRD